MTPGPFASLPQLAPNEVALLGSQSATPGTGGSWLARLSAGDLIATPYSLLDPTVTPLVTGSTMLVSGGQLAPPNSFPPHGANAETIVGPSADGKHLAMSVVGKGGGAPGVTPEQAAQLVLNMTMDSGILLDGGGSSTLVAQLPNTGSGVSVVSTSTGETNYPNGPSNQRFVGDGFLLYPQATPHPMPMLTYRSACTRRCSHQRTRRSAARSPSPTAARMRRPPRMPPSWFPPGTPCRGDRLLEMPGWHCGGWSTLTAGPPVCPGTDRLAAVVRPFRLGRGLLRIGRRSPGAQAGRR